MHDAFERLKRGDLTDEERIAALAHIRSCAECAALADSESAARAGRALIAPHEPLRHLEFDEEIVPFVEGTLDDAGHEIVMTHMESCATCAAEIDDLRALHAPASRSGRVWPAALAIAAAVIVAFVLVAVFGRSSREEVVPISPRPIAATAPQVQPQRYVRAEWHALVDAAVAARALPQADLRELTPSADVLRSAPRGARADLQPAGVVVRETRPQLTWQHRTDATYVVSIFRGEKEVMRSESLSRSSWTPDRELTRGQTYLWQIEVRQNRAFDLIPKPPAPPALFKIVSAEEHRAIEEATASHPSDHLLHAVLYARAGLESEAGEALRRAVAAGDARAQLLAHD